MERNFMLGQYEQYLDNQHRKPQGKKKIKKQGFPGSNNYKPNHMNLRPLNYVENMEAAKLN